MWAYHTCEDLNNKLLCAIDSYSRDSNHLRKSISPMVGKNDILILRVIERYLNSLVPVQSMTSIIIKKKTLCYLLVTFGSTFDTCLYLYIRVFVVM